MKKLDMDMISQILKSLFTISFQQIHYFRKGKMIFSTCDSQQDLSFAIENPFHCDPLLFSNLLSDIKGIENTERLLVPFICAESEENDIYYGILNISDSDTCIVGPLANHRLSPRCLREYMKRHNMKDFANYFIHTCTQTQTASLLTLLAYTLTGELPKPTSYSLHNGDTESNQHMAPITNMPPEIVLTNYQLNNAESGIQHLPYKIESQFLSYIREGDIDGLKMIYDQSQIYSSGQMSSSDLKQNEYTSVLGISFMARAAIDGGVNPYQAFDMNDLYLQKISSAKTIAEYQKIQQEATQEFISAIKKNRSLKIKSLHTEKCKQFIARHLNCPFTLDDLSAAVGLNSTYLSGLFHQYESMTIKEYTHRERINAAKNMLKYSDYKLSQIAEYFCFQSQSHFGNVFKKYVGITPMQYRRQTDHW